MTRLCEDCGDEVTHRRTRCRHIGCFLLVCTWCYHHVHACLPSHEPRDCRDRTLARFLTLAEKLRMREGIRASGPHAG